MPKKYTTEEFVKKASLIHNYKYDYSKVDYKNNSAKVCIICPEHGEFWQTPHHHLEGHKCPKCSKLKTQEEFIKEAKSIHGDTYDYSKINYVGSVHKICITCFKHGDFLQLPNNHLQGQGCPECLRISRRYNKEDIIKQFSDKHNNKYDYSKVEYTNLKTKVEIICPKHGSFFQRPEDHLNGQGCPECSKFRTSKGENLIKQILEKRNIKFIHNKNCLDFLGKLRPDFYLPDYNLIIEYDGRQHFKPVKFWGGDEGLLKTQERDKLKTQLCEEHNIKLVRISYTQFNEIEEIIDSIIC